MFSRDCLPPASSKPIKLPEGTSVWLQEWKSDSWTVSFPGKGQLPPKWDECEKEASFPRPWGARGKLVTIINKLEALKTYILHGRLNPFSLRSVAVLTGKFLVRTGGKWRFWLWSQWHYLKVKSPVQTGWIHLFQGSVFCRLRVGGLEHRGRGREVNRTVSFSK